MKTLTIHRSNLELGRSETAENMVEWGHQPGTLSLAKLQGKAKEYSRHYAQMRDRAVLAVAKATGGKVSQGYALVNSRRARVWVDENGDPVEITIRYD